MEAYLPRFDRDLDDKDIENLKQYKYQSGDYTYIDNKLNIFWLWLVEYLPTNLAPNLITVWALACGTIPAFLFVFWDPTLQSRYPAPMYILAAIGIFLYQTLDALDGKQARRIKAGSPLGQLFDHGCDSFSTAAMLIHMLVCLKIPSANLNLACYLSYFSIIYMSNLCEHFTHIMNTSYGQFGVSEIQLFQMAMLLVTATGALDFLSVPLRRLSSISWHQGFSQHHHRSCGYRCWSGRLYLLLQAY